LDDQRFRGAAVKILSNKNSAALLASDNYERKQLRLAENVNCRLPCRCRVVFVPQNGDGSPTTDDGDSVSAQWCSSWIIREDTKTNRHL